MQSGHPAVSEAWMIFTREAPEQAKAWRKAVEDLAQASALDPKTQHLAYLAVLAAVGIISGIPFHVMLAKQAGATREEVISALLIGLPAAGNVVTQALPPALKAYDAA